MLTNRKKGFTLTELIIVIVIIGILAAVLIPSITRYIDRAKITQDTVTIKHLNDLLSIEKIERKYQYHDITQIDAFLIRNEIDENYLIAKSSKSGNDIWFDYSQQIFILGSYDNLNNQQKVNVKSGNNHILLLRGSSPVNSHVIEDVLVSGYGLVSSKGSKVANQVHAFRNGEFDDNQDIIPNTIENYAIQINQQLIAINPFLSQHTNIIFQRFITSIDHFTFIESNLTFDSVTIPSSVSQIKSFAFTNLQTNQINIPLTIETFEENAFEDCNINEVNYGETKVKVVEGNIENIPTSKSTLEIDESITQINAVLSPSYFWGDSILLQVTDNNNSVVSSSDLLISFSNNSASFDYSTGKIMMASPTESVKISIRHKKNPLKTKLDQTIEINAHTFDQGITITEINAEYTGTNFFTANFQNNNLDKLILPAGYSLPADTEVTYRLSAGNAIDVGSYTVEATLVARYYENKVITTTINVTPHQLLETEFVNNIADYSYTGNPPQFNLWFGSQSPENLLDSQNYTLVYYKDSQQVVNPVNIGTYTAEYQINMGPNYTPITIEKEFKIIAAETEDEDVRSQFEIVEKLSSYVEGKTIADYLEFKLLSNDQILNPVFNEVNINAAGIYEIVYTVNIGNYSYSSSYTLDLTPQNQLYSGYIGLTYKVGTVNSIKLEKIYSDHYLENIYNGYFLVYWNNSIIGNEESINFTSVSSGEQLITIYACDSSGVIDTSYTALEIKLDVIVGGTNYSSSQPYSGITFSNNSILWSDILIKSNEYTQTPITINQNKKLYGNGFKISFETNSKVDLGNNNYALVLQNNATIEATVIDLQNNITYKEAAKDGGLKSVVNMSNGSEIYGSVIYLNYRGIQTYGGDGSITIENSTLVGAAASTSLIYLNDNAKNANTKFIIKDVNLIKASNATTVGIILDEAQLTDNNAHLFLKGTIKSNLWYTSTELKNITYKNILGQSVSIPDNLIELFTVTNGTNNMGNGLVLVRTNKANYINIETNIGITKDTVKYSLITFYIATYTQNNSTMYNDTVSLSVSDHTFSYK